MPGDRIALPKAKFDRLRVFSEHGCAILALLAMGIPVELVPSGTASSAFEVSESEKNRLDFCPGGFFMLCGLVCFLAFAGLIDLVVN